MRSFGLSAGSKILEVNFSQYIISTSGIGVISLVFIIVSHFSENINNPVGVLSHKMLPKINVAFSEKGIL